MQRLERFLEDQHPLVRSNLRLGLTLVAAIVGLHAAIFAGVRVLKPRLMFEVNTWLRLLTTLVVLMLIILVYNALKVTVQYMRGRGVFTWRSIILAYGAVILLLLALFNMPDVFDRAVSATVGRSYGTIHSEFSEICARWEADWRDEEAVTLDVEEEELGRLGEETDVYRVRNTVFFDFGDDDYAFGFACALREDLPADSGRARDYNYSRIGGPEYQFAESTR